MNTTLVKIEALKFAEYNPRKLSQKDFEALQRSIDEFGFVEPVVVNKTGVIVGGHQRVRAAQVLGLDEVPVVYVDLDPARERALNVALNKISGEWDEDQLAELLHGLDDELQMLTGFDDSEINKLQDGWVEDTDDKPKTKKYSVDELRTLKNVFKASQPEHTADAFIDWLQNEVDTK